MIQRDAVDRRATRAWLSGLFQAERKGFVADGGSWLWTLFVSSFKPFGFEGILDIIHAVTYVYSAAMADRSYMDGKNTYTRWITWIWQGEVSRVIEELRIRSQELGEPTEADKETSPRRVVCRTLTYLENHQQYMDYPRYRKLGLPITSSVMESTMKELNFRVKGTEKFWAERQQTRPGLHARSRQTP